jgi:hypothetical protein
VEPRAKAKIKLPPGAGITNRGSCSFLFITDLRFYRKKIMIAEVVFVNSYNLIFNPISQVKKANFQGIFYNYPEPGPEPELQF